MNESDIQSALLAMAGKVGGLESTVKGIETAVRDFGSQWRMQDEKASLGRRDLHQKMDAIRDDVSAMQGDLKKALADIDAMKPTVDAVKMAHQQVVGAGKASRWMYWVLVALTGGAAWVISNWLQIDVTVKTVRGH